MLRCCAPSLGEKNTPDRVEGVLSGLSVIHRYKGIEEYNNLFSEAVVIT